jgi:uncharacterized protein YeaC (DUF1315 family)
MNFDDLISSINPEIYLNLKQALELGKWADGRKLTVEQKDIVMQAIIIYENKKTMPEHLRTGYVSKDKAKDKVCDSSKMENNDPQPLHIH